MSLPCEHRSRRVTASRLVLAGLVLGAVHLHRAEAEVLNVCIDQANPTAAIDLRVARAIAKSQGVAVNEVDFEGNGKGDDGFPTIRFAKMAQSDCELIMGFPVDISNPNLPEGVEATAPYASTGFVLVRRGDAKNLTLGDLPKGSEVGIAQLDTYAGLLFATHPNIVMHVYESESAMLSDLAARRIAAGLAWQPTIEAYQGRHPKAAAIQVHVLSDKHMQWNLVALYVSRSREAADLFNKGLSALESAGNLHPLIAPFNQAAMIAVRPSSGQWPAPHLQEAVAWHADRGEWIQVSDPAKSSPKRRGAVPALYTADQATKGALAYYQNCAMCHGPNLDGQPGGYSGPALKGSDFADPSYDFHVSDIFNFVAKQMPAATPGSLSHQQDVEIMAFILQQNGYPPGAKELVYEEAERSQVPIRYHGK